MFPSLRLGGELVVVVAVQWRTQHNVPLTDLVGELEQLLFQAAVVGFNSLLPLQRLF